MQIKEKAIKFWKKLKKYGSLVLAFISIAVIVVLYFINNIFGKEDDELEKKKDKIKEKIDEINKETDAVIDEHSDYTDKRMRFYEEQEKMSKKSD